jgi:hypothetical protein
MFHGRNGAAVVVVVDIADPGALRRLAAHDHRDAMRLEVVREWIVTVQRKKDHAIDVAAGREVALRPAFLLRRLRHDEDKVQLAGGQAGADAPQDLREERVAENSSCRLGNDDADRVTATCAKAASCPIRDIPGLGDRPLDGLPGFDPDPEASVDDPRSGRARDTGGASNFLKRRNPHERSSRKAAARVEGSFLAWIIP